MLSFGCVKWGYKNVDDVQEIEITCMDPSAQLQDEYVINDNSTYQSLLQFKWSIDDCKNYSLPEVDFKQKTLLGKYSIAGGCSVNYKRTLFVNDKEKDYLYIIKVKDRGRCKIGFQSMNWMVVPKIPEDYSVTFKVK